MTNVSKHYTKQEREGNDGVRSWIDLSIPSHTIGIDNALESLSERIGFEIRGRLLLALHRRDKNRFPRTLAWMKEEVP